MDNTLYTGEETEEQENNIQEEIGVENGILAKANKQGGQLTLVDKHGSESKLSEVEQVLANKTFTRDEFIHLTELLQSRIVDSSSGSKEHAMKELHGVDDPRSAAFEEARRWREERRKAREESGNDELDSSLCVNVSSLVLSPDVPDIAGSSPADIAKAYMGVRPPWASSSALALQSEISPDNSIRNRLNSTPLLSRTKESWSVSNGQLEDRYRTPPPARTWNRIQSITRTPYYRTALSPSPYYRAAHSQFSHQNLDKSMESGPTSSSWTYLQSPFTGGREMLKRRSSVVDDGWASVGPIRRTRQKPLGVASSISTPFKGSDSSVTDNGPVISLFSRGLEAGQCALSLDKKPTDMDKHKYASSSSQAREDTSNVCGVPPQSSLTARKILEHLDRSPPSKETWGKAQLVVARDKSPSQLTMSRINGDSDIEWKYKGHGRAPLFTPIAASLERPASSSTGDGTLLQTQGNSVRADANVAILAGPSKEYKGLDNEAHGIRMATASASDGGLQSKTCNPPVFEFGSGNASKGPIFSFATSETTDVDTSEPKFVFQFESKPELLFSVAVEAAAAAASASISQAIMAAPTSKCAQVSLLSGTNHSVKNASSCVLSAPSGLTASKLMFESTGAASGGGLLSTSQSPCAGSAPGQASNSFVSSSGWNSTLFGASKPFTFGSGTSTSFGLSSSSSFGMKTTEFCSSTFTFSSAASFGLGVKESASSGPGSTPTNTLGSSTPSFGMSNISSCIWSSSPSFGSNIATSFRSSSGPFLGLGNHSLFGMGCSSSFGGSSSSFGPGSIPTFGLPQSVEAANEKSASQSVKPSLGYSFGSASLPFTGVAVARESSANNGSSSFGASVATSPGTPLLFNSSTGASSDLLTFASGSSTMLQKTMSGLTSLTPAFGAAPSANPPINRTTSNQMKVDSRAEVPSQLSSSTPSVVGQQPTSQASVALTFGSELNAASTGAQPNAPTQNHFASGAENTFSSAGVIVAAGTASEKSSRKIIRPKRDKTRRK